MNFVLQIGYIVTAIGPGEGVSVSARIEAPRLEVGQVYEITVDMSFAEGVSASQAGMPAPILQIAVPPSAELLGQILTTHQELSRNEFLHAPFERMLREFPAKIGFRLLREPEPDEHFALNVVAYASPGDEQAFFVRRRMTLSVAPNAEAKPADTTVSRWGQVDTLQIGDRATGFTLPRADGTRVSLEQFIGKKNIIITTYRAHW